MNCKKSVALVVVVVVSCVFGRQVDPSSGDDCDDTKTRRIQELQAALASKLNTLQTTLQSLKDVPQETEIWRSHVVLSIQKFQGLLNEISASRASVTAKTSDHKRQADCPDSERIRLVNGTTEMEGRLEVFSNGIWKTVCENTWAKADAKLVCSILGYPGSRVAAVGGDVFGNNIAIPVLEGSGGCPNSAGVICSGFEHYPVRIVNGTNLREGRVEVFVAGQWGTVCQNAWDWKDAQVVCKMFGYAGEALPVGAALFGQGTGQVWLRDVNCVGDEAHLLQCPATYPTGYRSKCNHGTDVGVLCGDWRRYAIRLMGGTTRYEGRVEIHMFDQWCTVNHEHWDNLDAGVVCSMLGYSREGATAVTGGFFGQGSGLVALRDLNCIGNEEHLLECPTSNVIGVNLKPHSEDAGVRCLP